jgi:hypothetical protein
MEPVHVHEILQPVPIIGSTRNPGRQYRLTKNAPYVNASQRWWIELLFNSDVDVAVFEKTLKVSAVRFIEFNARFFIEDRRMPDVGDQIENGFNPISKYAAEELPRLNTAVRIVCPTFVAAKLRCVVYIDSKGQGHPLSVATGVTHGARDLEAMVAFLDGPPPDASSLLRLYADNGDVREALLYFGLEGNPWPNPMRDPPALPGRQ